jgi:hypothetical protein
VRRILGTGVFVWCLLAALGVVAFPVLLVLAYGGAMAAFGPHYQHRASEPSPGSKAIGYLLIGLPERIIEATHLSFPASLLVWAAHLFVIALVISTVWHVFRREP